MNTSQAIGRMREVIRRQHKALSTEDCYIFWLRRYMTALRGMPQALSSEKKLERFLTDLARRRDVSASTQNQALNSVLFFYKAVLGQPIGNIDALRARRPVHARHAPTVGETQLLLQTIRNEGGYPTNLIARLLYGCGLRVTEPLNLRIKDLNLERRRLCIRGAKGGNDRVVPLPASLLPELTQQMQHETGQPEIAAGVVRVVGSSLLTTKKVEWLTALRVVWRRGVLYLVAASGPVPPNLREIDELRCLCLLLESRTIKFPQ